MRKTAIITLIIISKFVFAQSPEKGFSLSLKGGITLANQYGDDVSSHSSLLGEPPDNFGLRHRGSDQFKTGINIGTMLDYRFGKYFSVGFGTRYIEKGSRTNKIRRLDENSQTYYQIEGHSNNRQNFLSFEFPISFYLPINQNEIYLKFGYSYSYYLNSNEVAKFDYEGITYDYVYKNRSSNKRENGLFAGIGYSHSLSNKKGDIIIELEWNKSLDNLGGPFIGIPGKIYYYNQVISLSLGYKFKI